MAKKNSGLGRGLNAIFLDNAIEEESKDRENVVSHLKLSLIDPKSDQPRKYFDKEALEELRIQTVLPKCDGLVDVALDRPAGRSGDLVIAVPVKDLIALDAALLPILAVVLEGAVIPVGLQDGFRHIGKEFLAVIPHIVRPDPRSCAVLFALFAKEVEIVPPKLLVTDDDHFIMLLVSFVFLVTANMEKSRITKYL